MSVQEFGSRRTRATTKPRVICPEVTFLRCGVCGRGVMVLGYETVSPLTCCETEMERLKPRPQEEAAELLKLDYKITGGYNDNAVQVYFKEIEQGARPEWFYLKTFTGGYLRYVSREKRPPVIFPLADEDAYVYCDEDPCLECTFRCKRGYIIYGYSSKTGLIEMPLDRMTAQWQSGMRG